MNQNESLQKLSIELANYHGQVKELSVLKRFVLDKDEAFKKQLQPYINDRNITLEDQFQQCTKAFKAFAKSINRFDIITVIEKQKQQQVNELENKVGDILALFTKPVC